MTYLLLIIAILFLLIVLCLIYLIILKHKTINPVIEEVQPALPQKNKKDGPKTGHYYMFTLYAELGEEYDQLIYVDSKTKMSQEEIEEKKKDILNTINDDVKYINIGVIYMGHVE